MPGRRPTVRYLGEDAESLVRRDAIDDMGQQGHFEFSRRDLEALVLDEVREPVTLPRVASTPLT